MRVKMESYLDGRNAELNVKYINNVDDLLTFNNDDKLCTALYISNINVKTSNLYNVLLEFLENKHINNLTSLSISNCGLYGDPFVQSIFQYASKNTNLASLDISYNNIQGDTWANKISQLLQTHPRLTTLNLSHTNIRGDTWVKQLNKALTSNKTLRYLNISNTKLTGLYSETLLESAFEFNKDLKVNIENTPFKVYSCFSLEKMYEEMSKAISTDGIGYMCSEFEQVLEFLNSDIESLDINVLDIFDDLQFGQLLNLLQPNTHLITLRMSYNTKLNYDAACFIPKFLQICTNLKSLKLSGNKKQSFKLSYNKRHSSHKKATNNITANEILWSKYINLTLTSLDLSHNKIRGDLWAREMQILLSTLSCLTHLNLSNNKLGLDDIWIRILSDLLQSNTVLINVNLSGNKISTQFWAQELVIISNNNKTLRYLDLSNNMLRGLCWIDNLKHISHTNTDLKINIEGNPIDDVVTISGEPITTDKYFSLTSFNALYGK